MMQRTGYLTAVTWIVSWSRLAKFLVAMVLDGLGVTAATVAVAAVIATDVYLSSSTFRSVLIGAPMLVIPALYLNGAYATIVRFVTANTILRILRGIVVGYAALALILAASDTSPHAWKLLFLSSFLTCFLLASWRLSVAGLLRSPTVGECKNRVLIYGAGNAGVQLASALMNSAAYRVVGFIDDRRDLHGRRILGLRVYAATELTLLKQAEAFQQVLLAIPSATRSRRREILEHLERLSIKVLVMPAMEELLSGGRKVDELREVQIEDLLGRDQAAPMPHLLDRHIRDKAVMITGAGGSIGSELCRQALAAGARKLVLFERCEFALYAIERELRALEVGSTCELVPVLADICDAQRVGAVLDTHRIETIYHTAAYKHVPLVELNICTAVYNNVFGTQVVVREAVARQVENFVLVSTDKAVRPTSVMGASKRVCELIVQAWAAQQSQTRMSLVRFGNVLASSGSVVPLFKEQIRRGGPVTVTHPEITRYFMTIPEAAQLVIQAGAMGGTGEVFVLDMGEPVKILDLAERMIRLSGLDVRSASHPDGDIAVEFTGLRPGEKLYEELLIGADTQPTDNPRIFLAHERFVPMRVLRTSLDRIERAKKTNEDMEIIAVLMELVDGYRCTAADDDESQSVTEAQPSLTKRGHVSLVALARLSGTEVRLRV